MLHEVQAGAGPTVLTQRGRAAAVLLSIAEYERTAEELAMLRSLLRGERDIASGALHDIDEVFAEALAVVGSAE